MAHRRREQARLCEAASGPGDLAMPLPNPFFFVSLFSPCYPSTVILGAIKRKPPRPTLLSVVIRVFTALGSWQL